MKSAATNTISEVIQYDYAGGAVSKPIIKTEYYSDTRSQWVEFDNDLESRTIELSNENKRVQNYSFMPPVKTLKMTLNNFEQVYSTGSGNAKATILKKNLLVRCWSGYEMTAATPVDESDDFTTNVKHVHTQKIGSTIRLDNAVNFSTLATAAELGSIYGTAVYGSAVYAYPGYYTKTFSQVTDQISNQFNVDVNKANNFSFKYRASQYSDFHDATWGSYTALNSGSNEIPITTPAGDFYFQYIIRFEDNVWNTASYFENAALQVQSVNQFFKQGVFVIDDPVFQDTKVNISGRDYIKKALETEINLSDLSGSNNVQTVFTKIFDRCNIPYDTADWDSTSTTITVNSTIAEDLNNISGWKALDYGMDAMNAGDDDWRFKPDEDGQPVLKIIPTDVEADWTVHYFYNIENIRKGFDSDKQLQRITVANKNFIVDPESTLKSVSGAATTSLHVTYATAIYVRYIDNNDTITSETIRGNTGVTFAMNTASGYDIDVLGCTPKNALTVEKFAEAGNSDNIKNSDGSTYKRVNPFINTQDDLQKLADYIIGVNEDPKFRIEVSMNPNPLLELDDKALIFDRYTYTDDIYILNTIKEQWTNPGLKHRLVFKDSGLNLGAFIWDRGLNYDADVISTINLLKYDKGFVWDQDLPIGGSDTASYIGTKEVQFV